MKNWEKRLFCPWGNKSNNKKSCLKMKWKCFSIVTKWKFVWFYGFVWEWANDLWVSLGSFWICGCGWVKPFDLFLGSAMETIFESFAAVAENTFNRKTTWKMSQIITQHIKPHFFWLSWLTNQWQKIKPKIRKKNRTKKCL